MSATQHVSYPLLDWCKADGGRCHLIVLLVDRPNQLFYIWIFICVYISIYEYIVYSIIYNLYINICIYIYKSKRHNRVICYSFVGATSVHMTNQFYDITFTWRNNRMTHLHDDSKAWHTGTWQLITWKAVTWLCIYMNNIYMTAHWYETH